MKAFARAVLLAVLAGLSAVPARAEPSLPDYLAANPKWRGVVGYWAETPTRRYIAHTLTVTFHFRKNRKDVDFVSYRWEQERERDALQFTVREKSLMLLIPPKERDRRYFLEFENGMLKGHLTGIARNRPGTFRNDVMLQPVR